MIHTKDENIAVNQLNDKKNGLRVFNNWLITPKQHIIKHSIATNCTINNWLITSPHQKSD